MDFTDIDLGEFGRQLFLKILRETSTEGEFQELFLRCRDWKEQFVDLNFPAARSSLISNWDEEDFDEETRRNHLKWKTFVWKRAAEINFKDDSKEGLTVFRDKVEPSDIQ